MSLSAGLKSSRIQSPEKVAIAFGEQSRTYAEFDDITDTIASNLIAAGLKPGDRVALHLLNGPEFAFVTFACLKAGCIAVPINTRLKAREIDYILRHSGAACYVGLAELYSAVSAACPALTAVEALYVTGDRLGRGARTFESLLDTRAAAPLPQIAPDQNAAILYTSGTTAHPKGVLHTHSSLTETARAM